MSLTWSAQLLLSHSEQTKKLPGDKILLPPSALEQLLAAAPLVATEPSASRPYTSTFDPYNPYTFAAERQARSQYQDQQRQLPYPLTFRLVNPENGRVVYAGIREFSAEEGQIVLSNALIETLGIKDRDQSSREISPALSSESEDVVMTNGEGDAVDNSKRPRVTVHAHQLPKGTFVKFRPLEAGYDPEDWKSLLEQYLRTNFTTLTNGEVLVIPSSVGGKKEIFRFLVDGFQPEGDAICIVDTDLEVDIEPLNEDQAKETLKRIAAKAQRAPGTAGGSSPGGELSLFRNQSGQVLDGDYVDYEIPSWDRSQGLEIELSGVDDNAQLDLLVSPFSARQRVRPREEEYVIAEFEDRYPKRIRLAPTNVEMEHAEAIWVSIHAAAPDSSDRPPTTTSVPHTYQIRAAPYDPKQAKIHTNGTSPSKESPPNPDEVQCKNCHQWVPQRTLFLHENFCLRNNIACPKGCGQVFQKRSAEFENHWHCPHDDSYGNSPLSHVHHDHLFHASYTCPSCDRTFGSIPQLAQHRTSVCPGKLILCQFCHLQVPQEGDPDEPNAEALLSGLTPHELVDGGRTTECHLCNKIVRLRDMATHLKHHEIEKSSRPAPRVCRNVNCGRTLDGASRSGDTRAGTRMGNGPGNDVGLCSVCFGPLYVTMHDPEGKALRRRVERRYLTQLISGCGKSYCRNEYCKTGRKNKGIEGTISSKDALPMIKPLLEGLSGGETPLHFCVDEPSQKRRTTAELLAAERDLKGKGYGFEWCVAALEAEGGNLDRAREWLKNWAPDS